MNPRKLIPVLILLAAAAIGTVYWLGLVRPGSNGDMVRVAGNIEVIDAEVSFKIPGRVAQRRFDEGETVAAGDLIAVLEKRDLEADLAARQAERDAALAALAELQAGSRPEEIAAARAAMEKAEAAWEAAQHGSRPQEIEVARAAMRSAQAEKDRLESELVRAQRLLESQTITQEVYDRQRAAYDVAAAQLREATERLNLAEEGLRPEDKEQARRAYLQTKAQYDLVVAGPRDETRAQAAARVQQAQAAVELAQVRLSYATIVSPLSGVVLSKNVEPGEYVAAGTPVVTVGDLKHPWLRAYIEETDLPRVKYGQEARVTTDGYPGKVVQGRIGFIASEAEFTPKNVQTPKERTRLVYRVKIYVDNPEGELKRGMPAEAEIVLGSVGQAANLP